MFELSSKMEAIVSKFQKKRYIFFLDFHIIFISYLLAFLLRLDFQLQDNDFRILLLTFPLVFFTKLGFYILFNIYKIYWRYTSVKDLISIIKISTLSNIVYGVLIYLIFQFEGFPRSVVIIDWFIFIMLLGGIRFFYRIYFKRGVNSVGYKKRCLIIGSGDAAEFLIREMVTNRNIDYLPLAILDDDPITWNRFIHGIKIYGAVNKVYEIAKKLRIEEIIIAIPSTTKKEMQKIIEHCETCRNLGIQYKTIPSMNEILSGRVSPTAIREVKLEDLINRELVVTNQISVRQELNNKVIMITGAAGSIGSELVRQIYRFQPSLLILIDRNENNLMYLEKTLAEIFPAVKYLSLIVDITDVIKLEKVFNKYLPDFIFHAAAYKHVRYMENSPDEAVKNNVYGTYNLAKLAEKYNTFKFVLISTDKAVNPTNVMGCTKRLAELCILNLFHNSQTKYVIVRFGNVIGSDGSVVPIFQRQIKNGGPITITHPEMKRYFMTIPEAVRLTLQASNFGNHKDILILNMGEQIPIIEIAENLITLSGYRPYHDIQIKFIGIQPGEKLSEELWNKNENPIPTKHPKIFKTSKIELGNKFDSTCFNELIIISRGHGDNNVILDLLKKLVVTYEYESADKIKSENTI